MKFDKGFNEKLIQRSKLTCLLFLSNLKGIFLWLTGWSNIQYEKVLVCLDSLFSGLASTAQISVTMSSGELKTDPAAPSKCMIGTKKIWFWGQWITLEKGFLPSPPDLIRDYLMPNEIRNLFLQLNCVVEVRECQSIQ